MMPSSGRGRHTRFRFSLRAIAHAISTLSLYTAAPHLAYAQPEFSAFRITGVDGYAIVSGQRDATETTTPLRDSSDTESHTSSQRDLRGEIAVNVHSYVYHPKLLTLDINLGVIRATDVATSDELESRSHDQTVNYRLHGSVLSDKPARGTVFLESFTNTPAITEYEIFTQHNRRYGFTSSLGAPLSPIGIRFEASREHNTGSGSLRTQDDQLSRMNLRTDRSWGTLGESHFDVDSLRQDSASGSLNLPIVESRQNVLTYSQSNQLHWGTEHRSELSTRIELTKQRFFRDSGQTPELNDLRAGANYGVGLTDTLGAQTSYDFARSRIDEDASYGSSIYGNLRWTPEKTFTLIGSLRSDLSRAPQLNTSNWSGGTYLSYSTQAGPGKLGVSASLDYQRHNQVASNTTLPVVGEHVRLVSTTFTGLSYHNVVTTSVAVFNLARSQQYLEGVDYQVTVVGTSTRLQRIVSGSITEGEEVLVDYSVDTGGTYASQSTGRGLNLSWDYKSIFGTYLRINRSTYGILSGSPTFPLNPYTDRVVGVKLDLPMPTSFGLVIGGALESENRDEVLAPFTRTLRQVYVQGDVPAQISASYRVGAQRERIDSSTQALTADRTSYDLMFNMRTDSGVGLTVTGLGEHDEAGTEPRDRRTWSLRADWRYRQVSLMADWSRVKESQGLAVRARNVARISLRRDF